MGFLLDVSAFDLRQQILSFFGYIATAFSSFRISDALDIIVLATLIFFSLRFLSGRKAGALIAGIVICVCILVACAFCGFHATYYVFNAIFRVGVILLIVIFQPEIRDGLEKIGHGPINGIVNFSERKNRHALYSNVIENVCVAVRDLSKSRTGALIVITRTTRLDEILQTGSTINADVNSFLLRNLFFNKAPLHDGAVVIDNARIVAAGCLLPLTRRTDVDGDLGTRHRAAIGMSETSDAVIIVVSEETGTISVACDCALTRHYNYDTLHELLTKLLI